MLMEIVKYGVLFIFLGCAAFLDIRRKCIPNRLILAGACAGIIIRLAAMNGAVLLDAALGALCAGGLFYVIFLLARNGIGMGDIKLIACTGFFTGLQQIIPVMVFSVILCGIFGVILLIAGRLHRKSTVPFAPFLLLGTAAAMLFA